MSISIENMIDRFWLRKNLNINSVKRKALNYISTRSLLLLLLLFDLS